MSGESADRGRYLIVASRFNERVTERLLAGALACLEAAGLSDGDVDVIRVPGAWELPIAAQLALESGQYEAAIAIGCVIRGDTPHFEHIAGAAATGLARVSLDAGIPVAFGVLTTDDADQALDRAGGRLGNKGWEAAATAVELADLRRQLRTNGAGT